MFAIFTSELLSSTVAPTISVKVATRSLSRLETLVQDLPAVWPYHDIDRIFFLMIISRRYWHLCVIANFGILGTDAIQARQARG